ncbi:MAG TPA: GNAT family N-acetyltransferase [Candidatus Limnocylindria bacterium]|nr:GNAT family N-acetyltransferase [Candidatus Limnocylindria bacterium]
MTPRPIDRDEDLPAVADFLGRTRAAGGLSHPGGIQWWLRDLWNDDRSNFGAFIWADGDMLTGFALVDGSFVVTERSGGGPSQVEQLDWLANHLRARGTETLDVHMAQGDPAADQLHSRGFIAIGTEFELVADTGSEPSVPDLPEGFRFASLSDVTDQAYIEGHRAAWSDKQPSPYRPALHEAVKEMPQFRSDLVTIVIASDGSVASYCIGWMDERSKTLEIEPLGTHREFRRLGLARSVVKQVHHRAWANGARRVMVWNNPDTNPEAYRLYTGAGMAPARTLLQLTKRL